MQKKIKKNNHTKNNFWDGRRFCVKVKDIMHQKIKKYTKHNFTKIKFLGIEVDLVSKSKPYYAKKKKIYK